MDETAAPIATDTAPTEESGKAESGSSNEDKTVAGLSKALRKALDRETAANKKLAEFIATPSEEGDDKRTRLSKLERENAALRLGMKYPDVAKVIDGAIAKGIDPSWIDEDFIATLRSVAPAEDDSPTHNPARLTATDPNVLKGLKSLFED